MIKMFNKDERVRLREQNREILEQVSKDREDIIARKTDDIRKRHEDVEQKIRDLQEQRSKFLEKAIIKKEFLKVAKEQLRIVRESFLDSFLLPQLENCRQSGTYPVTAAIATRMAERHPGMLFVLALSEKDLEVLINKLPDEGIPSDERDVKILEIDTEIARLAKIVEDELNEIKK